MNPRSHAAPRRGVRTVLAGILAAALGFGAVLVGGIPAQAATNPVGAPTYGAQTFYAYADAGELPRYTFTQGAGQVTPVTFTITDPEGDVQQQCVIPASSPAGTVCASTGLTSSVAGIWTIEYDPGTPAPTARYAWTVEVVDAAGTVIPGRTWTLNYEMAQSNAGFTAFSLWIGTREGYAYRVAFNGYGGIISGIAANGFGLVEPGTCIPLYRSAQLGDPAVGFSDACGDRYKLFLEAPADDLPETAQLPDGTMDWVRPAVVPASATNLTLTQDSPFSRAGDIQFDLAGVNGGYTVQLDTDSNGVYTDPVDRTIRWGSPPGQITVPFDGLDGLGSPLGVCTPLNAKVVVDRVGEAHLVLNDVERLAASWGYGLSVTGATPGVVAANPKLYWDDTNLAGIGVLPYADGRAGLDTSTTGAHGWTAWGNNRSIENWTYYQAEAGAETTIPSGCDAALTLEKDGVLDDTNGNGFADAGETIDYTFTVRNAGNAPVAGVTIDDDRVTDVTPATADIPVFGEQVFTAAPYTVTQADIDAGVVHNVASAAGTDPLGEDVTSNDAEDVVPTIERAPALTLDKNATLADANNDSLADEGETIAYTFDVVNTGNVTLQDVTIDDPRVTGVSPASVDLAPGQSQTFTATAYTVTQADIRTGSVDNTAVARATAPTGPVQSNTDSTSTPTATPDPQLVLTKTATITGDEDTVGRADVGDTITYTFGVENTGNVDVTGVSIDDPRVATTTPATQDIPAGETRTYTATYVATQADVDFGSIPNTAVANGTYTGDDGPVAIASAPDTAVVPTPDQEPGLELIKEGTLNDGNANGRADLGETIDYTFTVTNTGNVTMVNTTVIDDRVAAVTPATATIAPGDSAVFTANGYSVTQEDVDTGEVVNTAFARGNIPGGAESFSEIDDHVVPAAIPAPALTVDKIATLQDGNGNGTADAGEQIAYAFSVTNTGNVTLSDVTVEDDRISGLLPESIDFLPPASVFIFEAEPYTVTAADVEAGEIVNVATATATTPDDEPVESPEDTVTTEATPPAPPAPPAPPVENPSGEGALPATGADPLGPLALAALLLFSGVALVIGRRVAMRRSPAGEVS
ncbi:MAG TPA: hypothetical protein VN241_00240 [Microbacterium sp.]|nr:hypothetical protein [Microbacterium sp.]